MTERVSVIITTYFRNERLRDAIESVFDLEYDDVELIVVDDSGEAHARPIVERYSGVTYIPQAVNTGPPAARTIGAAVATGSYIQFLDDDDRLRPDKLRKQVDVFRQHDNVGVVYTGMEYADGRIKLPGPEVRGEVLDEALRWQMFPCYTSSMLMDSTILRQLLPLDNIVGVGDLELIIKLAKRTRFEFVNEALVWKSLDENSLSSSMEDVNRHQKLFERYSHLYEDEQKDWLRAQLSAMTGRHLLRENQWSLSAIWAFSKALSQDPTPLRLCELLVSLTGRPTWETAFRTYERMTSN